MIGVLGDGLVMLGVSSFWQKVIKGAVIVFAVIMTKPRRECRNALRCNNSRISIDSRLWGIIETPGKEMGINKF